MPRPCYRYRGQLVWWTVRLDQTAWAVHVSILFMVGSFECCRLSNFNWFKQKRRNVNTCTLYVQPALTTMQGLSNSFRIQIRPDKIPALMKLLPTCLQRLFVERERERVCASTRIVWNYTFREHPYDKWPIERRGPNFKHQLTSHASERAFCSFFRKQVKSDSH